jgi:hypothetical protein
MSAYIVVSAFMLIENVALNCNSVHTYIDYCCLVANTRIWVTLKITTTLSFDLFRSGGVAQMVERSLSM